MSAALSGRTAFVTGAARGIGRGIALALAAKGAQIIVADRHPEPFRGERYYRLRERWSGDDETLSTAAAIESAGGRAMTITVDVADRSSVDDALERERVR